MFWGWVLLNSLVRIAEWDSVGRWDLVAQLGGCQQRYFIRKMPPPFFTESTFQCCCEEFGGYRVSMSCSWESICFDFSFSCFVYVGFHIMFLNPMASKMDFSYSLVHRFRVLSACMQYIILKPCRSYPECIRMSNNLWHLFILCHCKWTPKYFYYKLQNVMLFNCSMSVLKFMQFLLLLIWLISENNRFL